MAELVTPIQAEAIRALRCGDTVSLSGIMVTGRDAAHKWMMETFIRRSRAPQGEDLKDYQELQRLLEGGVIYHCGPVVAGLETKTYKFVAAGPTTSIREEPYQAEIMRHFHVRAVIGKGGMGPQTLKGCEETPAVYLHAIGGAASYLAQRVVRVVGVLKLELGVPEAMWVIEVKDFPVVVTMDSHGGSLHAQVQEKSEKILKELLART